MVAAQKARLSVDEYHSYEIDETANLVSQYNYPDIIQHGSVVGARYNYWCDLLMAGSPCQGFSKIGRGLNFADPRSRLYFEFERAIIEFRAINPDLLFFLENVDMAEEWRDIISERLGVQPIFINSKVIGAVSRPRWYWTNIPNVTQPKPINVTMTDIIEPTAPARYWLKNGSPKRLAHWEANKAQYIKKQFASLDANKGVCFTARMYANWKGNFITQHGDVRQLSAIECERAQGLPDGYCEIAGDTHAYRQLGNGWHCDTVAHILKHI